VENVYPRAAEILSNARSLFVLTGAGISAESGIPTFRDADGLWKNYSAEQLATPEAFQRDPALVWEWYHWRQALISKAEPNPGHHALVVLERNYDRFLLLTQNVDNLHRRAGSRNVLELHGNIFRALCLECGRKVGHGVDRQVTDVLPKCECGGLLRPDVVWFGELIPSDVWRHSLDFLAHADLAMICGTSGVVWPAAMIPNIACERGLKTIEINLERTVISNVVDVSIPGKTGEVLPELIRLMGL
jgi:NAD-dependent deacetylase